MYKIRRGDIVQVAKGRDRGKKAKVLKILAANQRALVEGINLVKKHTRRSRDHQQGGITSIEAPISLANLMLLCKQCNRPARIGFQLAKDGSKLRICRACRQVIS